ncbi:hypothetical protein AVEN_31778-1 [Araneus ventricosus]|uniref:Uncharacterized protein n=1 Tax=Araneus ventricosus TaxID=182803 RepID=A0A4Y2JUA1_ARAVE|nr:hypothetical protein AVEN_31778-1 [Araneus ventricosus]
MVSDVARKRVAGGGLAEERDYALHPKRKRKPLDLIQSFLVEKQENSQWEKKHPLRPENRVACFDLQEREIGDAAAARKLLQVMTEAASNGI